MASEFARRCAMGALIAFSSTGLAQQPWGGKLREGIVHIELPLDSKSLIGTGAIVKDLSSRYYVVTATHNLFVRLASDPRPQADQCVALPRGVKLRRGNSGGPELPAQCVHHLRSDISIIQLLPPAEPYPSVALVPRPVTRGMSVFIAGFPLGVLDYHRSGKVTSTEGEGGTVVADFPTTWGFSGAPYADADGAVIGFHAGGARGASGFPHFVPVWKIRRDLEDVLGSLEPKTSVPIGPVPTIVRPMPPGIPIPITP